MMQTASCGTAGRKRMYRLGFDIGGTHIACGIINDETFEIIGKDACAFFRGQSAEKTAQCMAELAKNTAARCGTDFQQIETVGVCIPGTERLLTPITSASIMFRSGKLLKKHLTSPLQC